MLVTTQSSGLANSGKIFTLDCETVNRTTDKELAWVTLLDFDRDTCYDTFVKPLADIVDYNTNYSGITPEMVEGVTIMLADIQRSLLDIVSSNDILVGHSIDTDLRFVHLEHRKVKLLFWSEFSLKPISFFEQVAPP
jgi:RNA exonuclease 1